MKQEPHEPDSGRRETRVIPKTDDEGKNVVGAGHLDIGMVTAVVGDTMYIDPNTALTDEVKRKLNWDGKRSTDLPIPVEFVSRIDDEIVLSIARDERYRKETR